MRRRGLFLLERKVMAATDEQYVKMYTMVECFHVNADIAHHSNLPTASVSRLRQQLITEEYTELCRLLYGHDRPPMIELAKEIADVAYVVYGTAVSFGWEGTPKERENSTAPAFFSLLETLDSYIDQLLSMLKMSTLISFDIAAALYKGIITLLDIIAERFGIDFYKAFCIVHKSNMSKLKGGVVKHDGKVMKSESYVAPDLTPAIKGEK
jgi:hypothetical protein